MNLLAKVISAGTVIMGVLGMVSLLAAPEFDGYGFFGGILFVTVGCIALTYIARDDEVKAVAKRSSEEQRIAAIVAERMAR